MPQKSIGHVDQSLPDTPTPQEVFRYRSTIRISIETATFEFDPAIPLDERRAILLKDPGWRIPWPPPLTGAADRDDLILAFSRIVGALGLKAGIPGSTAEAVRSGLFEMFSSVPQAIYANANTESYRRFAANASIGDDGSATWGYYEDRPGLTVPGVDYRPHHLDKSGVEIFVQNLLRADLLERIEKLHSPGQ